MNKILWIVIMAMAQTMAGDFKAWTTQIEELSAFEKSVLINKSTERAFSGKYVHSKSDGVYTCKVCDTALYVSKDKFDSGCGWPSFDDAIEGAIKQTKDADGRRTEITCANCGAHMGHVFKGEGFTAKDTRHCVNSISLNFQKKKAKQEQKAYFAGGCFWGVEYYLESIKGVKSVSSGFMGGHVKNPKYYDVVRKNTGHLETVEVIYDPSIVSYESLAKTFFEIHDPTQTDGQGPDIGSQYLSAIFVSNAKERQTVQKLVKILENKNLQIATKILNKQEYYEANKSHQDYYKRKGGTPYCHRRVKLF